MPVNSGRTASQPNFPFHLHKQAMAIAVLMNQMSVFYGLAEVPGRLEGRHGVVSVAHHEDGEVGIELKIAFIAPHGGHAPLRGTGRCVMGHICQARVLLAALENRQHLLDGVLLQDVGALDAPESFVVVGHPGFVVSFGLIHAYFGHTRSDALDEGPELVVIVLIAGIESIELRGNLWEQRREIEATQNNSLHKTVVV